MGVKINNFICDTPARAFIKGVKGHNGYFACERCEIEGDYSYISHTMCFSESNCQDRTDASFHSNRQEEHHLSRSPLEVLPLNMVDDFSLDYLHLICLGIVKKLITYWINGNKTYTDKLLQIDKQKISDMLLRAGQSLPNEFSRAVRPLDVISFWKGTEFRTFLLYTGVEVLKNI